MRINDDGGQRALSWFLTWKTESWGKDEPVNSKDFLQGWANALLVGTGHLQLVIECEKLLGLFLADLTG